MPNIKRANTSGITKSGVAIADVPDRPTIGTATAVTASTATVTYTAATTGGTATTFTATSTPGSLTGTGSSPITVAGLTGETSYTFTVRASNSTGSSPFSATSNSITTPSALAFESIATYTGNGGSGTVTFSSIPSTYKHLQLRITALGTAGAGGYPTSLNYFRVNSDSNSDNYSVQLLRGDGSTRSTGGTGNPQGDFLYLPGGDSSFPASAIIDIFDYTSTNKFKTLRSLNGSDRNGSGSVWFNTMLWKSTSAISTLSLQGDPTYNGNWATGSKFALYGIKG
jgi:hypothetical protein